MAQIIKAFAVNNTNPTSTIYTVPAGKIAKVQITGLYVGPNSSLDVGHAGYAASGVSSSVRYQSAFAGDNEYIAPGPPLTVYLVAGQTIMALAKVKAQICVTEVDAG